MFFIVSIQLNGHNAKKCIPLKWIKGLDSVFLFNYGKAYLKSKPYTIFLSSNTNDEPDFDLRLLEAIDEKHAGCYTATILHIIGKFNSTFPTVRIAYKII